VRPHLTSEYTGQIDSLADPVLVREDRPGLGRAGLRCRSVLAGPAVGSTALASVFSLGLPMALTNESALLLSL
jgi:hypothetical protein